MGAPPQVQPQGAGQAPPPQPTAQVPGAAAAPTATTVAAQPVGIQPPQPPGLSQTGTSSGPSGSQTQIGAPSSGGPKRKEIYKYEAPWTVYSMNWSVRPDKRFRLALGSFVEEYNNKVQIVSLDEESGEFTAKSTFDHPYPTTKIMWIPDSKGTVKPPHKL